MKKSSPTRNPEGLDKKHPIALRLMPEERIEAERIALNEGLTMSALARNAYLKGLAVLREVGFKS
jgi:hypothetical protein